MLASIIIALGLLGYDRDPLSYPGSRLISGGVSSPSSGFPPKGIVVKSELAQSSDDYSKVVDFYDQKLNVKSYGTSAKADSGHVESLTVLGPGPGQHPEMKVYVAYEPKASTTVVVSRGIGEKMTCIHLIRNSHTAFP